MKTDLPRLEPRALRAQTSLEFGSLEAPDAWVLDDFMDVVPSAYKLMDTVLPRRTLDHPVMAGRPASAAIVRHDGRHG